MLKRCTRCKDELSIISFYKDSSKPDGLNVSCKECHNAAGLARRTRDGEAYNKKRREYYAKNKHIYVANAARGRASRLNATPTWLTDEQRKEINNIYRVCQKVSAHTNVQHNVDHIVPLKGETVCGLHVPWNLQILPEKINKSKGNRYGSV